MRDRLTDGEFWDRFYVHLQKMRPFFLSACSVHDYVDLLFETLSDILPIQSIALIRNTQSGSSAPYESTAWGVNGKMDSEDLLAALKDGTKKMGVGCKDLDSLTKEIQKIASERIPGCTTALFPITYHGESLGLLCVATLQKGTLNKHQQNLLELIISILGLMFSEERYADQKNLYSHVLTSILENMSAYVYITDPETDRILFMNKTMKKSFHLEHPEGEICWKVLQKGQEGRCTFCPIPALQKSSEAVPFCTWEELNTVTGRTYENYDSLVPWLDGTTAHLQQSVDVTDSKRLSFEATRDELTGIWNRRAGKQALRDTLKNCQKEKEPVTICLYDVNMLKSVNDAFGHSVGDQMLVLISQMVQKYLPEESYQFRLSGDEFVAVFPHWTKEKVTGKMIGIREKLIRQQAEQSLPYRPDFCYGLVQVEPESLLSMEQILTAADEAMYEQKRTFHINLAERRRQQTEPVGSICTFTYDEKRLYDALVQSTDDYVYVCNMKTGTFRYPKSMVEEFGLPGEVVENAAAVWGAKVHPDDKQAFLESNQEITDGRTNAHCVEYRALNRRGEWVWVRCRGRLERDENGEPVLFAGIITNLEQKNRMDHITGLFNKFAFETETKERMKSSAGQTMGMMILGLDEFKHINDLYDRAFGDEVIRITAQKIQALLPGEATVYRLDGDEFGLIFLNGGRNQMEAFYRQIQEIFCYQQEYQGNKYTCTISAGCAVYPEDGAHYLELRKAAGYSLEHSKNHGKNCATFFSKEILDHQTRALELIELLRAGAENGFKGYEVYFQPQVDAISRKIVGAEALMRFSCPEYGAVSPVEFIPLLEQSGLIIAAGQWIFNQALLCCKKWLANNPDFVMSINLSYIQVTNHDFPKFMEEALVETGVPAKNIVVEMTESYFVKDDGVIRNIFEKIRKLGAKVAMDDFGTGYSSLGVLKRAPADIVKIDRAFIRDIKNSSFDATFIRFIVALCHDVGIQVCLEGVETEEEYRIVSEMDLNVIQGFLFGRPVPGRDFQKDFIRKTD